MIFGYSFVFNSKGENPTERRMMFRFEETTFHVRNNNSGDELSNPYQGNVKEVYTINDAHWYYFVFTYKASTKEAFLWVDTVQVFKGTIDFYDPTKLG